MWRRFRYHLNKDFPGFVFRFNQLSKDYGEVIVTNQKKLNLKLTFSTRWSLRKDRTLFNHLYEGMKYQIKNLMFKK